MRATGQLDISVRNPHTYDKFTSFEVAIQVSDLKVWKIRTSDKITVIILKFVQCRLNIDLCIQKMQMEWQTV